MTKADTIFETIHGSRLYGFAHAGSDTDVFYVTDSRSPKARHHYSDLLGLDQVRIGLGTFLLRVSEGSHQSLEALFSPYKVWRRPEYRDFIENYRVFSGAGVSNKYQRTITAFCYGDFKRRRHAARLTLNLRDMISYGRFSPVMNEEQITWCNEIAQYEGAALRDQLEGVPFG